MNNPRMPVYQEPKIQPMPSATYRCAACGNYFEGSPQTEAPHYCLDYYCVKRHKDTTLSKRSRVMLVQIANARGKR